MGHVEIGGAHLGWSGWLGGVCAPVTLPGWCVREREALPLIRAVTGDIRRDRYEARHDRERVPPYWAYLERENLRRGVEEIDRARAVDSVECGLGAREVERVVERGGVMRAGRGEGVDGERRYGAARVGDVSPTRSAERVTEGVRRVYRVESAVVGSVADVVG